MLNHGQIMMVWLKRLKNIGGANFIFRVLNIILRCQYVLATYVKIGHLIGSILSTWNFLWDIYPLLRCALYIIFAMTVSTSTIIWTSSCLKKDNHQGWPIMVEMLWPWRRTIFYRWQGHFLTPTSKLGPVQTFLSMAWAWVKREK